jgi:hypothetical protein
MPVTTKIGMSKGCSLVAVHELTTLLTLARHHPRPQTVFELVSDMWNSPDFNPVAPASECHSDFQSAIMCSYEQVEGLCPATPQRIEDVFTSMRSDLLRIITRWEQSGQGEGGMDAEDELQYIPDDETTPIGDHDQDSVAQEAQDCIGSLEGRPARALQSRASFLNGRPPYLLYFWEVADKHQLLQSSLQRLSTTIGASDASCAPSTSADSMTGSSQARKRRQDASDEASMLPLVQSIRELAECQRQLVLDRSEERRHEQDLGQQREASRATELSRERKFRRRAELSDLARKYRKLNAELDPTNENSARLSEFYISEGRLIDDEMRDLDNSM